MLQRKCMEIWRRSPKLPEAGYLGKIAAKRRRHTIRAVERLTRAWYQK